MISILTRTAIVYLLLSFAMKLMGKREIGELDVSDLVSALLISEIAAIPIDDPDIPLLNAIIPILFILSVEILLSYAKTRSAKLKRCIEGESVFLIYKGVLDQNALRENRISLNEFLCEMRTQSIGDISLIDYAVLEQSGKISILQKGKDSLSHVLIIVGEFNGINENNIFGGTTYELIHNIIKRYDIPACFRFPVGHSEANMPLIEGATVTLNIEKSKTELKF